MGRKEGKGGGQVVGRWERKINQYVSNFLVLDKKKWKGRNWGEGKRGKGEEKRGEEKGKDKGGGKGHLAGRKGEKRILNMYKGETE